MMTLNVSLDTSKEEEKVNRGEGHIAFLMITLLPQTWPHGVPSSSSERQH